MGFVRIGLGLCVLAHAVQLGLGLGIVDCPPIVDLGYATYQGHVNQRTGNVEFLGMRYAAPPLGDLRWREPREPASVPGVQLANALPPNCPRGAMGVQPSNPFRSQGPDDRVDEGTGAMSKKKLKKRQTAPVPSSEDCLFLNVFVPGAIYDNNSSSSGAQLPVVVWIHGGGYIGGGIGNDGNDLIAAANGGVVVVQMQYRIGLFGFLAGEEVKNDGVLNAGLQEPYKSTNNSPFCGSNDKDIAKFGGNPEAVTIWGQSAGAGSVVQHLVANGGKTRPPLFRGATMSSTFLPSQYDYNGRIPEAIYKNAVTKAGCHTSKRPLRCLRGLSTHDLIALNIDICTQGFYGTFVFAPVVDGTFIRELPSEALRKGRINTRNLFAVTNTYEGVGFVDASSLSTVTEYISNLFPLLPNKSVDVATRPYKNLGSALEQIGLIMGDAIFTCPTYALLGHIKAPNAFKAHFAVPPARHAGDVAYYYPS